jgi:cellulose synthase/poly-beta-1,6-N-acetylglucosamine synthase-like glycosyltransferase
MSSTLGLKVGLVVIGRNEGERLARCLASVHSIPRRVYVDSGSTDGSVELARRAGVTLVEMPSTVQLTAARARNAGLAQLLADEPELEFVQMIDGDCELQPQWIESALTALQAEPGLALVFGRRRERYPERSVYNALCDDEWNVPIGEAPACGGDALFRVAALRQVGLYNAAMIAGEDSELCMRLRKAGWRLRCINAEMTLHDAAIMRFGQWWRRSQRAGHGYGEMAYLHPDARNPNWPRSVRSILVWAGLLPALLVGAIALSWVWGARGWILVAILVLIWPMRMLQLAIQQHRRGLPWSLARASGILLMLGKLPQLLGLIGYYRNRLLRRTSRLIEYKGAAAA